MLTILRLYKTSTKLIRLQRYSSKGLQVEATNNFKTIQIAYFQNNERKKQGNHSSNSFPHLLFSLGLGVVLLESASIHYDEKRFMKACQYGLTLEVKR